MFKIENYPKLLKLQKKYHKLDNETTNANLKNQEIMKNAGCFNCKIYLEDLTRPLADRFANCGNCKYAKKIGESFHKYLKDLDEVDELIINEYSKAIYEVLNLIKPQLLVRRTKEIIKWENAFLGDFDQLSKTDKKALFCILEEVGGPYRLIE